MVEVDLKWDCQCIRIKSILRIMCEHGSNSLFKYSRINDMAIDRLKRHLVFADVARHLGDRVVDWGCQSTQSSKVQVHCFRLWVRVRCHLMQANVNASIRGSQACRNAPQLAGVWVDGAAKKLVVFSNWWVERHLGQPNAFLFQEVYCTLKRMSIIVITSRGTLTKLCRWPSFRFMIV